jgi:hypothetical protein
MTLSDITLQPSYLSIKNEVKDGMPPATPYNVVVLSAGPVV